MVTAEILILNISIENIKKYELSYKTLHKIVLQVTMLLLQVQLRNRKNIKVIINFTTKELHTDMTMNLIDTILTHNK